MAHSNRKNHHSGNRNKRSSVPVVADIVPAPGTEQITGPIGIPQPPDYIFKHRTRNREAPSQEVWGHGTISYAPNKAEYIENEGCFVYYYGVPFPSKTVAPVEAIYGANVAKRILINILRLWGSKEARIPAISLFFMGKKKRGKFLTRICEYFNLECDTVCTAWYLEDGYYCKVVKEIRKFAQSILISLGIEQEIATKTAEIIGMVFEYDNAYRYRLQDLLDSANVIELLEHLPREIDRLVSLQKERERTLGEGINSVSSKFKSAASLLRIGWHIPWVKNIIQKAIQEIDFDNCKFDEADLYHTALYADYDVRGKKVEDRIKILQRYHGDDLTKWPPRIEIRNTNNPI